jgi:phosphoribosylformylglycinamidine synthase
VAGRPPAVDLNGERALQQAVLKMIHEELLASAHDCSEGGLACALAECALGDGETPLGVSASIDDDLRPAAAFFGESQGRILVSCDAGRTAEVLRIAEQYHVPARKIGVVVPESDGFSMTARNGKISVDLTQIAEAYFTAIPSLMDAPVADR